MKNERLLNAIGKIDDDMISNAAQDTKAKKKHSWGKWGAMAACLCLVAAIIIPISQRQTNNGTFDTEPKKELTLEEAANDPVFGRLFPTTIMDGYIIDAPAGIYDDTVLSVRFFDETTHDEMVIEVASKEWFYNQYPGVILNTVFYRENSFGTGSYIDIDGGEYVVQYSFSRIAIGSESDHDRNESFLKMVNSAEQFGDFVLFDRYLYRTNDLSRETLAWLEWYNALTPENRLLVDSIPAELLQ